MEVTKKEDILKAKKIYSGGWFFDMFELAEYELIKENKTSFRFKVRGIKLYFKDGEIEDKKFVEYETTITLDKILYGKIPFYTEKEEAVEYFLEMLKDSLERAKRKVEILPKVISNIEKEYKKINWKREVV